MEIFRDNTKYHPKAFQYFEFDRLDAFHNQDILSVVYGGNWNSILITENEKAFLHSFSKNVIGNSEWYDIDPFVGYNGAIVNTNDRSFIGRALGVYSDLCREERIIAEVMRFNCILKNHAAFENNQPLKVLPAKEIVVVDCVKDKALQLGQFQKKSCSYMIKKWASLYQFRLLDKDSEWKDFIKIYKDSLKRVDADEKWYFSDDFFCRIRRSERFKIFGVWHETDLVSTAVVIAHPLAGYYFLAANSNDVAPGAGELLIFRIALDMADKEISYLILGGGNSSSQNDPLLRFKKKFARTTRTFFIGKLIHNPEIFNKLIKDALRLKPELDRSSYFLKYRLAV